MNSTRSVTRVRILLIIGVLLLVVPLSVSAAPYPAPYHNGFENASDATPFPTTADTETLFGVTRVASGTNGVTSAAGAYHAIAPTDGSAGGTMFTRLGGYSSTFPSGGYRASIDIYLDMAQSGIGDDKRIDWGVAANQPDGNHRRDFIFSIGTNGTGGFVMSAGNNTPGWPGNPGRDPYTITTTGWYTFQHVFRDNSGVLAVDMRVLNAAGVVLKSWTLSDPSDLIGTTVGGNRYGWLIKNAFADLPIDNIRRSGPMCTTTCYVDTAAGSDLNGGTSTSDAFKTIQKGVTTVQAGGQVIVAAGSYPENVSITKSLTLTGAGDGNTVADTIVEGTGRSSYGIFVSTGVVDVTIENLRVQNFIQAPSSGIWADGQNDGFTVQHVTVYNNGFAGYSGGGVYMNGPVDDVLIDDVTAYNNRTRGIVIWNGFKTHITLTNNDVQYNNCCGIELQDGTASGVTATGNTVKNNLDSGMAFTGLMAGAGANLIANNTLENNGRFGIEIKLPNGTGLVSGDGSIVVEDNDVSRTAVATDLRDYAGIAVYRRGWVAGNNNVDIPTGVIVRDNTVSGYQQNNGASSSTGFGIVVEGAVMRVTGNTLNDNDVGVQVQRGHTPYVANTNTDGDQSNLADDYFGRGNSPVGCADVSSNIFSGNGVDSRSVGGAGGLVVNTDTGEGFCTIQAAIDDADTLNGHTIEVPAGVWTENVIVNKSLTINGANAGVSPNDPTTPLTANPARGAAETEMTVTGGASAFKITSANVTIDGFKFTNSAVGTTSDIQLPIIGAGVNFGGDAPGVKIVNNRFVDTSRNLVTFNGPTQMAGGTIDNNRVENPTRAAGICGTPPATASGACGYQLFNPWRTDNLSFQHNVAFAPSGNRDRVRTLNVSWSTNVAIKYNTLRYTCIYTCFSIPLDASPVEVAYNDAVTDAGQVLALHPTWTTGVVNVHHNQMTTGADFPIAIDNVTADLDNVHINRNAIYGTYHVRNGNDSLTTPGAETLDATCNWWGASTGPTAANFYGPTDFDPWLTSSNLDGPCAVSGYLFSTDKPGVTASNVAFGSEDVLLYDIASSAWSVWFDGSAHGLTAKNAIHNLDAIYVPDPAFPTFYLSFTQNARVVPGITGKVDGMDVLKWDGAAFSMYFDGQDVGLTNKTQEKIDALHILPGAMSPINGGSCLAYLLVSTQGPGWVPNYGGGRLTFGGEDVLGFCMTGSGYVTTGYWHKVLDGVDEGMPRNATDSISFDATGQVMYLTTRANFNVDAASGGHSMIYMYDFNTGQFSGPLFSAPANGLPKKVDGLELAFD